MRGGRVRGYGGSIDQFGICTGAMPTCNATMCGEELHGTRDEPNQPGQVMAPAILLPVGTSGLKPGVRSGG